MKRRLAPAVLPALFALLLAGCTARFQAFPFVTAEGERIELRESPGLGRDRETVFAPTAARLTSPLYSLRRRVDITEPEQAFAISYRSSLHDCRLSVLSDRKTVLRAVRLPPSGGNALRFLVPLATGEKVWGFRLSADHPAPPGESLDLVGAGTGGYVRGFAVTQQGLSVDGSVEVDQAGTHGVAARITEAVREEMARGIWDVRIDIAPEAGLQDGTNVIRFTGNDGNGALFAVDQAAGLSSLIFARGSMGFLPRGVSTRLSATKLDITFLSPERPIPADPGMILTWDRGTWRRPDFELYAWDRFPRVLIFDTASYDVQDGLFNRLAFFVEKAGYRDSIEDPSALEGKHGYNAHDYRAEDLARFFTAAAQKGISLTPGEAELEQILEENDLIRRTGTGFAPGDGAVISISRSSSTILRRLLLSHESAHGEFFTLPAYREGVEAVWEALSPVEKDVWLDFLSSKAYDATDHYLVVNEFQAYLFQQDREGVESFQGLTLSRMKARGAAAASLAERLLSAHPHSFLDAFDALDGKLRAAGGPPGGHALAVFMEK